jgi:hypothetical protein
MTGKRVSTESQYFSTVINVESSWTFKLTRRSFPFLCGYPRRMKLSPSAVNNLWILHYRTAQKRFRECCASWHLSRWLQVKPRRSSPARGSIDPSSIRGESELLVAGNRRQWHWVIERDPTFPYSHGARVKHAPAMNECAYWAHRQCASVRSPSLPLSVAAGPAAALLLCHSMLAESTTASECTHIARLGCSWILAGKSVEEELGFFFFSKFYLKFSIYLQFSKINWICLNMSWYN